MAGIDIHCADCTKILGDSFCEVHELLDQFFDPGAPTRDKLDHRAKLHNVEGLKTVFNKFGERASVAAIIHLLRDMNFVQPTIADVNKVIKQGLPKRDWLAG